MKTSITTLTCTTLLSAALSTSLLAQSNPTLLLVHGAHFTADSWQSVQDKIKGDLKTVAVNLPGRNDHFIPKKVSLELSAAALCMELGNTEGDKIIAAHSQAGAVVNATLALCPDPKLKKVIYVTAVSPKNGESAFKLLSKQDGNNYFSGINYNKTTSVLEISNQQGFVDSFAPNANASQKAWLKQHAVPEPAAIGDNHLVLDQAKFNVLKKYYIFAKKDKVISLPTQQKIAARMNITASYTLDSGHLPMLTHASELATLLQRISVE